MGVASPAFADVYDCFDSLRSLASLQLVALTRFESGNGLPDALDLLRTADVIYLAGFRAWHGKSTMTL